MPKIFMLIGVAIAIVLPMSASATATSAGLWITDDVNNRLYKIDPSGAVDPSVGFQITGEFGIARGASGIAVDNTNGTLWLAAERAITRGIPGGVVNWSTAGSPLSGIAETTYGGEGTEGVAVDLWAGDGTLWVVDDPEPATDASGDYRARVRHIDRTGAVLGSWPALRATTNAPSQQEIAVDPTDGTLWIVDNSANRIFHFARPVPGDPVMTEIGRINPVAPGNFGEGTPGVDRLTTGLQGITVDPDGTLWVTARQTSTFLHGKIFHITRAGVAIASFASMDVYGGENPTGIAYACTTCAPQIEVTPAQVAFGPVPPGESRDAEVTIANVGSDVLAVTGLALAGSPDFTTGPASPSAPFSLLPGSSVQVTIVYAPTGGDADAATLSITSDDPAGGVKLVSLEGSEERPRPVVDLGAAAPFTLLGLEGAKVSFSNSKSGVVGHAGLGPRGIQNFADGFITGTFYVDPSAGNGKSNNVVIGGGTVVTSLSQAAADAHAAASTAAGLATTRTFKELKSTTTVTADHGLNVFRVGKIELGSGKTVTLAGPADAVVVVNVTDKLKLSGGAIRLAGGLQPSNVILNVVGSGEDVALSGGSAVNARVLATARKTSLSGASIVNGLLIAGGDIALTGGSQVRAAA